MPRMLFYHAPTGCPLGTGGSLWGRTTLLLQKKEFPPLEPPSLKNKQELMLKGFLFHMTTGIGISVFPNFFMLYATIPEL